MENPSSLTVAGYPLLESAEDTLLPERIVSRMRHVGLYLLRGFKETLTCFAVVAVEMVGRLLILLLACIAGLSFITWLMSCFMSLASFGLEHSCDVPLRTYTFLSTITLGKILEAKWTGYSPHWRAGSTVLVGCGTTLVGGVLLLSSQSCDQFLFFWVAGFVTFQPVLWVVASVAHMLHQGAGEDRPERPVPEVRAVLISHEIVQGGTPELVDPENGVPLECPICCENLQGDHPVVRTQCRHCFHEACLISWFERRSNCPMCRARGRG
mmetsp:Transcript_36085/g.95847  ORF Transcript_36085/g.95847 Transcript_36085/m.95847 type:complete len:268 (-) Transcript_36085:114-917(-)